MIPLKWIQWWIRLVEQCDIDSVKVPYWFGSITIIKRLPRPIQYHYSIPVQNPAPANPLPTQATPRKDDLQSQFHVVTSPYIGTYYDHDYKSDTGVDTTDVQADEVENGPTEEEVTEGPFVFLGQSVAPDTILCVIRAMKLNSEVFAGATGTLVGICTHNDERVEYGQVLFVIRKDTK